MFRLGLIAGCLFDMTMLCCHLTCFKSWQTPRDIKIKKLHW